MIGAQNDSKQQNCSENYCIIPPVSLALAVFYLTPAG